MKIKTLDRLLLTLLMLLVIVFCAGVIAAAWQIIPRDAIQSAIKNISGSWLYSLVASIAALILLLIAGKLLFLRVTPKEKEESASFNIQTTANGSVSINVRALEALILREAKRHSGVKDCSCVLKTNGDAVNILLRLGIAPEISLIELTAELQSAVKQNLESLTGLKVQDVQISVENTEPTAPVSTT